MASTTLVLLHLLQIEGDADSVDQNRALFNQILIGDFGVGELAERDEEADELEGLGSRFGFGSQFI